MFQWNYTYFESAVTGIPKFCAKQFCSQRYGMIYLGNSFTSPGLYVTFRSYFFLQIYAFRFMIYIWFLETRVYIYVDILQGSIIYSIYHRSLSHKNLLKSVESDKNVEYNFQLERQTWIKFQEIAYLIVIY